MKKRTSPTMSNQHNIPPFHMRCTHCGQTFVTSNMRAFGGTMRRHRKQKHEGLKGAIRYERQFGVQK